MTKSIWTKWPNQICFEPICFQKSKYTPFPERSTLHASENKLYEIMSQVNFVDQAGNIKLEYK